MDASNQKFNLVRATTGDVNRGRKKCRLLNEKFQQVWPEYNADNPINFLNSNSHSTSSWLDLYVSWTFHSNALNSIDFFFEFFPGLVTIEGYPVRSFPGWQDSALLLFTALYCSHFRTTPMKLLSVTEEQTNLSKEYHLSKILMVTRFRLWVDYVFQKSFRFSKKNRFWFHSIQVIFKFLKLVQLVIFSFDFKVM